MKKVFGLFGVLVATLVSVGVHALSFAPDTVFLEADTEKDCTALGGSFTEWYGETYCTTSPATLTTAEQAKVTIVANKILELIEDNNNLYEPVISLLETYKAKFVEQGDMKRLAIANLLIEHITTNVSSIPEACTVRYDGCNTCQVMEDGNLACTKMACLVQQEPMCKVYEKTIVIADHTEACVGVGPMDCLLVQDITERQRPLDGKNEVGKINCGDGTTLEDGDCVLDEDSTAARHNRISSSSRSRLANALDDDDDGDSIGNNDRTYFYDTIEGFEYVPGYIWTLLVEETHLDPATIPADGSSISWELKEVVAIDAEVPATCSSWYDGCNTCSVGENDLMACTLMFCEGEPLMPYCMDEGVDSTKATDYNSSRSNKNSNG